MMEKLNLWSDDPEEILLNLGFGYDEPDLSGRIPARFLHYQSKARGITIQVFLEAQKNRLDLENPDVGNRFRQLQVLQEVTTTFSGLIGQAPLDKRLPPDVQERRRKMAILFRRASKKSLGQKHPISSGIAENVQPCSVSDSLQDSSVSKHAKVPLMRVKPVCLENGCLDYVANTQAADADLNTRDHLSAQEKTIKPLSLEECFPKPGNTVYWSNSDPEHVWTPNGVTQALSGSPGRTFETKSDVKPQASPSALYSSGTNTPIVGQCIPFAPRPTITIDPCQSPTMMIHSETAFTFVSSKSQKPSPLSLPLMSKHLSPLLSPQLQKTTHSHILPDIQFSTLNLFSTSIHITSFMTEESKALDSYHPPESFCNNTQCYSLSGPSFPKPLPTQLSPEHSPLTSSDTVTRHQSDCSAVQCLMNGRSSHKNTSPGSVLYPEPSAPLGLNSTSSVVNECRSHHSETSCKESSLLGPEEMTLTDTDHRSILFKSSEDEDRLPSNILSLELPGQPALACDSQDEQNHLIDPVDAILSKNAKLPHKQAAEPHQNGTKSLTPASHIQSCSLLDVDGIQQWNKNQAMANRASVNASDKDSAGHKSKEALIQAETDRTSIIYTASDDHSGKTEPQKHQENHHSGSLSKQNKLSITDFDACERQVQQKNELKLTTESLDMVQETSVDVSDGENEDMDFFQQLNAESKVYWAEPIQITSLAEELNTFHDSSAITLSEDILSLSILSSPAISGTNQISGKESFHSDPCLSPPHSWSSLCASTEKCSNPSGSGQTSSLPSSHIVQRKDVPVWTQSKQSNFPNDQTLDTSTPLRALQSWKNLQSQRNALTQRDFNTLLSDDNQMRIRTPQRPPKGFPSTTSFPLLCSDLTLCNATPVMLRSDRANKDKLSKSLEWMNTLASGSAADEQQKAGRIGSQSPDTLEGKTLPQCCCSCHHPQSCCGRKYPHPQHISCSIEEWEKMMDGLQQFHSVFNNMVKKFSEEQAAVHGMLSDTEREDIHDIEELRCSIKVEAEELEQQLKELSLHYEESLNREMDRLLYEQSQLCSQVVLSGTVSTSSPTSRREAATQCSLLPWPPSADAQTSRVSTSSTGNAGFPPKSSFGSDSQVPSPTSEKLDILGLLHRVGKSCIQ